MANEIDIAVRASTAQARHDIDALDRRAEQSGSSARKHGAAIGMLGQGIAGGLLAVAAGVGLVVKTGIDENKDFSAGQAQLVAGLKSTHAVAGTTVKGMEDLASSVQDYSGQTDDSIVKSEQLLLTFTNIRNKGPNKIFDLATKASADMAAKMGGDASSNAILLGKALNDPVKGISALTKVGVSFTQGQKDSIAAMVKAGDTAGAQKIILKELNTEFGGAAKAAGDSLPGQLARAKRSFEDVSQSVVAKMLPVLTRVALFILQDVLPAVGQLISWLQQKLRPVFADIADFIRSKVIPVLQNLAEGFRTRVLPIIREVVAWIVAHLPEVGQGFKLLWATIQPVVMALYNLLLTLWKQILQPMVGWIVAHWTQIQAVMKVVFIAIGVAVKVLAVAITVALIVIADAIKVLAPVIRWWFDSVVGPVCLKIGAAFKTIGTVLVAVWNNVMGPTIRIMVSGFLDLVSTLVHGAASAFGWVPGLGGKLKAAARAIDQFKEDANKALNRITQRITIGADTHQARTEISGLIREVGSSVAYLHVTTVGASGPTGGRQVFDVGHRATGGIAGGLTEVGEHGRELLELPQGSRVRSNPDYEQSLAGHRAGPAVIEVRSSGSDMDNFLIQMLRKAVRVRGGNVQLVFGT